MFHLPIPILWTIRYNCRYCWYANMTAPLIQTHLIVNHNLLHMSILWQSKISRPNTVRCFNKSIDDSQLNIWVYWTIVYAQSVTVTMQCIIIFLYWLYCNNYCLNSFSEVKNFFFMKLIVYVSVEFIKQLILSFQSCRIYIIILFHSFVFCFSFLWVLHIRPW